MCLPRATRAAMMTAWPKKSSAWRSTSPVCSPMRTRSGFAVVGCSERALDLHRAPQRTGSPTGTPACGRRRATSRLWPPSLRGAVGDEVVVPAQELEPLVIPEAHRRSRSSASMSLNAIVTVPSVGRRRGQVGTFLFAQRRRGARPWWSSRIRASLRSRRPATCAIARSATRRSIEVQDSGESQRHRSQPSGN